MPDAGTNTDTAAASTASEISNATAAGWAFKAATFAYSIYSGIKKEEQRKADMELLGHYHDLEMEALDKMDKKQDWYEARRDAADFLEQIDNCFDTFKDLDPSDSEFYVTLIQWYQDAAEQHTGIKDSLDNFDECVRGQNGKLALLSTYCSYIKSQTVTCSDQYLAEEYFLFLLSKYRKAIACYAFFLQMVATFPDTAIQQLTVKQVKETDWSADYDAETLLDDIPSNYKDLIANALDYGHAMIYGDDDGSKGLGNRYRPKDISSANAYGMSQEANKKTYEYEISGMGLDGWLNAPYDEDGDQCAVVGIRMAGGKKKAIIGKSYTDELLSIAISYTKIEDIVANNVDAVKKLILDDRPGSTKVDADKLYSIGDDGCEFLTSTITGTKSGKDIQTGTGSDDDQEKEATQKVKVVTGARLCVCKQGKGRFATVKALGLKLKFRTLDLETMTLSKETTTEGPAKDSGLYSLLSNVETRDYIERPGGVGKLGGSYWKDDCFESFSYAKKQMEPLRFLIGAGLHRSGGKDDIINIDLCPLPPSMV